MGECHVHAGIDPENIRLQRALHPEAEFLIHPECGCSTSVLEAMSAGDIDPEGVQILSTEGMIKRPALSERDEFIVATEVGILHRLRRENPAKRFFAANERASCAYMKVTTLPKVKRALERHASIASPCRRRRREPGASRDRAHDRHRRPARRSAPFRRPRSTRASSRPTHRDRRSTHGNAAVRAPSVVRRRARSRR